MANAAVWRNLKDAAEKKATFVLTATYENIKRIVTGKLDPMQAMMTRKLSVQGNLAVMMRSCADGAGFCPLLPRDHDRDLVVKTVYSSIQKTSSSFAGRFCIIYPMCDSDQAGPGFVCAWGG